MTTHNFPMEDPPQGANPNGYPDHAIPQTRALEPALHAVGSPTLRSSDSDLHSIESDKVGRRRIRDVKRHSREVEMTKLKHHKAKARALRGVSGEFSHLHGVERLEAMMRDARLNRIKTGTEFKPKKLRPTCSLADLQEAPIRRTVSLETPGTPGDVTTVLVVEHPKAPGIRVADPFATMSFIVTVFSLLTTFSAFHVVILAPIYEELLKHIPLYGLAVACTLGYLEAYINYKIGRLTLFGALLHFSKHAATSQLSLPMAITLHFINNLYVFMHDQHMGVSDAISSHLMMFKPGQHMGKKRIMKTKVFNIKKWLVKAAPDILNQEQKISSDVWLDKAKESVEACGLIPSTSARPPPSVVTQQIEQQPIKETPVKPALPLVRDGVRPTVEYLNCWLSNNFNEKCYTTEIEYTVHDTRDEDLRVLPDTQNKCDPRHVILGRWSYVVETPRTLWEWLRGPDKSEDESFDEWLNLVPQYESTYWFCPHLVTCGVREIPLNTNLDAIKANARARILRIPTLNLADTLTAAVLAGSELMTVIIAQDQLNSMWVPDQGPFGTQWFGTGSPGQYLEYSVQTGKFTQSAQGQMKQGSRRLHLSSSANFSPLNFSSIRKYPGDLLIFVASMLSSSPVMALSLLIAIIQRLLPAALPSVWAAIFPTQTPHSSISSENLFYIGFALILLRSQLQALMSGLQGLLTALQGRLN